MRTVRRTTSRQASRPASRRAYASVAAKTTRKKPAKRRTKAKKAAAPLFAKSIKTLMSNLNTFSKARTKKFGKKDPIAKSLTKIHSTIAKELKKFNIVNPNFVRTLKKINPSLKGKGPKSLRGSVPKIAKQIREQVRNNVKKFFKNVEGILSPMQRELKKLENKLNREIKSARSKKMLLKVDPSLKRRINTLNNKLTKFKSNFSKKLNSIALHGNREIKSAVKNLKKMLDETQKSCRRNLTILNRYAKSQKRKAGWKVKTLFTASQAKAFESQWNQIKKKCDSTRKDVTRHFEQLKSIKLF